MDNMSVIFVNLNESNSEEDIKKFAEIQAKSQADEEKSRAKKRKLSEDNDDDSKPSNDTDAPLAKVARE